MKDKFTLEILGGVVASWAAAMRGIDVKTLSYDESEITYAVLSVPGQELLGKMQCLKNDEAARLQIEQVISEAQGQPLRVRYWHKFVGCVLADMQRKKALIESRAGKRCSA
jgi:hypothetical protein